MQYDSLCFTEIQKFYGNNRAKRSQVPLINHIKEGLIILDSLGVEDFVKDAFCLHPLFQDTDSLLNVYKESWLNDVDARSLILAMEYRHVANSYLSKKNPSQLLPLINKPVKDLLIADKVQNYKDFLIHHKDTHDRSSELDFYFNNWFKILNINYIEVVKCLQS